MGYASATFALQKPGLVCTHRAAVPRLLVRPLSVSPPEAGGTRAPQAGWGPADLTQSAQMLVRGLAQDRWGWKFELLLSGCPSGA